MRSLEEKIAWFAIISRVVVVLLSAIFNHLIPDHDAGVFLGPLDPSLAFSLGDKTVQFLFGGLVRWDAHYFIHIALHGYTFENCLAFFPIYPMTVRVIATALAYPLHSILNLYSMTVLSAVLVNIFCFVKSATVLYKLGVIITKDTNLAYTAALLYCLNPASIFFTAPYSEAMYAWFSFYGMLMCANNRYLASSLPFGLSGATRSNGILNLGFFVHPQLKFLANLSFSTRVTVKAHMKSFPALIKMITKTGVSLVTAILLSIFPFILFQTYGYHMFCIAPSHNLPSWLVDHARDKGFVIPGAHFGLNTTTLWCNSALPLAYSYVQSNYWQVGFLKYYQWKQIPNFLLATPAVLIILSQAFRFAREHRLNCLTLGLSDAPDGDKHFGVKKHLRRTSMEPQMLVYIFHAAMLTVFCVLCIHVQVTTRMIASSCPVFYWFVANLILENKSATPRIAEQMIKIKSHKGKIQSEMNLIESVENLHSIWRVKLFSLKPKKIGLVIYYYFCAYFIFGTALFSNFLPWT